MSEILTKTESFPAHKESAISREIGTRRAPDLRVRALSSSASSVASAVRFGETTENAEIAEVFSSEVSTVNSRICGLGRTCLDLRVLICVAPTCAGV